MKIFKTLYSILAVGTVLSFSSCIEETLPEDSYATEDQMSNVGLASAINGMSAQFAQGYLVYGEQTHETDLAYPQFMVAYTEMMGDMYPGGSNSGYDWFRTYNKYEPKQLLLLSALANSLYVCEECQRCHQDLQGY